MSAPSGAGSGGPAPEGVVILGMHRSGTSLITRLVSLLGLSVCHHEDLLVGRALNPRGHWESKSLLHFNDRLLEERGGTWFCPPLLRGRELARMLDERAEEALATLERAHPVRPWVWKDPRTCVLMPFWAAVLERQAAAYVLVVRHPLEVSDSLARRSGCTPLLSIALWERYTREAMLGAAGRPLLVCTYDGVLADPLAWSERLRALLGELGLATRPVDGAAVDAFVMEELRHSHRPWSEVQPGALFSEQQVELAHAACEPTAQRSYEPPPLAPETPATESIFQEIRGRIRPRGLRALRGQRSRGLASLPARLVMSTAAGAGVEDRSGPPVSVVLARGDTETLQRAIAVLAPTLPAGSEMLVASAGEESTSGVDGRAGLSLRVLAGERPQGEAAALALGVQHASGRIVVLTTGALMRCEPWYGALERALAAPEVGGVGPVLRSDSRAGERYFGQAFADADLRVRVLRAEPTEALVSTGLLPEAHCAYSPALLAAAGGIDAAFDSACAAVAELSVRLWRMGFRCCIVPAAEVWAPSMKGDRALDGAARDCGPLHDRLRIAALHLDPSRLQAFTARASRLPSYEHAAARLAESDVEHRRATIEALCPFPAERYFESFPLQPAGS